MTLSEGAHVDVYLRPQYAMHCPGDSLCLSFASVWQRFDTLTATKFCTDRKLRVKNRFLNPDEQTYCEHDHFTYHVLVRVAGWLVRLTFASMLIEITGSELVLINLHDTRCAGRGEVSRVGASHRVEVNVAFDAHLYGTWAIFAEAPLLFRLFCAS